MKVENKIALVTGGASGIGKAVCFRLLEMKAKFLAFLDIDDKSAEIVLAELSDRFGSDRVKFIHCDVANDDQLKRCFQEAFDVHGALDIVVNNAGLIRKNHRMVIEVNLIAVINGCFFAKELMTKTKREEKGVIVNTASVGGLSVGENYGWSTYYASKYGVVGFTKALPIGRDGTEFSKDLRVVAICPHRVITNITETQDIISKEELQPQLECTEPIDMSIVTDSYVHAIENDSLNGILITVEPEGFKVLDNE